MSYFEYPALTNLRSFVFTNSEALQNASLLLGGQPALHRTRGLIDNGSTARALTRGMRTEIQAFYDLLKLVHVSDPHRSEAGFFALIDPAWPVVEEICLLSDKMSEVIEAFTPETSPLVA